MAGDPMIDLMLERARARVLDEKKEPNDELLLFMDHTSRETRKSISRLEDKVTKPGRSKTQDGGIVLAAGTLGAVLLQFLKAWMPGSS